MEIYLIANAFLNKAENNLIRLSSLDSLGSVQNARRLFELFAQNALTLVFIRVVFGHFETIGFR